MKSLPFGRNNAVTWLLRLLLALFVATALPLVVSCTGGGTPGTDPIVVADPGGDPDIEQPGVPASIIISSTVPSPARIGITGTGATESIRLNFTIVDVNDDPVTGSHLVDFEILHGGLNGGEKLNIPQAASTDSDVWTVFNSGIESGIVQVHASMNSDDSISADVTVTITGGLPSGDLFGLSFGPLNIHGLLISGLEQSVRTDISDFFSNPVAPNIQVNFQTDYASVTGTGTFLDSGEGGTSNASVFTGTITTGPPRPTNDGFVLCEAQTIGGNHTKVLSIAVHPSDENVIYAGTDGGGIFKTIDGGTSWKLTGSPLKDLGAAKKRNLYDTVVRDLVIDSNNPAVIYAATKKGVFVSINAGENWQTLTGRVKILADPMGVTDGSGYANGLSVQSFPFNYNFSGVRSRMEVRVGGVLTDSFIISGNSIQILDDFGSLPAGMNVEVDYDANSAVPDVLFSLAVNPDPADFNFALGHANTILAGTEGDGVWRTVDGGKHWRRTITLEPPAPGEETTFGKDILSLGINAARVSELFAGSREQGLFKTINGGDTWTKVKGLNEAEVRDILVEPVSAGATNVWIAGAHGLHYTTDGGTTWQVPSVSVTASDPTNDDVRAIERDPNDGTLYAATFGDVLNKSKPHGGIYKSTDNGANWSIVTDLASTPGAHALDSLAVFGKAGADNDILLAGAEGRSMFRSADSGGAWTLINGEKPTNLTNTLFATGEVLHSGNASISITQLFATYRGYGASSGLYNTEIADFYIRVSDHLGNTLVPGTTIDITVDQGSCGGCGTWTLPDTTYRETDYYFSWSNDLDAEGEEGELSVKVNGEPYGEITQVWGKFLHGIFAVSPSSLDLSMPAASNSISETISSAGGSDNHDYSAVTGNITSSGLYTYTQAGLVTGDTRTDTITVTDIGTGDSVEIPVIITKE